MYKKRNQNGQSIVELTVSLVGILSIFCGFLLISKLGIKNVDNVIKARELADDNAINSIIADPGISTFSWDAGTDNYMYTADDTRVTGVFPDPALFSGELQNNSFNLKNDLSKSYIRDNYATYVGDPDFIFLSAAELTSGSYSSSPVQLDDLERLLYVDTPSITLKDENYMPFTDHAYN